MTTVMIACSRCGRTSAPPAVVCATCGAPLAAPPQRPPSGYQGVPRPLPEGEIADFVLSEDGQEYVGPDGGQLLGRTPGPVPLASREGVFAHSFKCSVCDLEFALVSWQRDRAGVGRTFCPECGLQTPMVHYLAVASTSREFTDGTEGAEVYQLLPLGGNAARMMDDSRDVAPERFGPPLTFRRP